MKRAERRQQRQAVIKKRNAAYKEYWREDHPEPGKLDVHRDHQIPCGKEYWKSRLKPHGEIPGPFVKKRTHRKERRQGKKECNE